MDRDARSFSRGLIVALAFLLLVGCGEKDRSSTQSGGPQSAAGKDDAERPPAPTAVRPDGHLAAGELAGLSEKDLAKRAEEAPSVPRDDVPADLILLFTNNLDGEIEPCG